MTTRKRRPELADDLFTPTLTQSERRLLPAGKRPWRLSSQFYVAFFGGPLAAGMIGYLNGKRLGLPRARLVAILAVGAVGFLAALSAAIVLVNAEAGRGPRLMIAVAGVAAFLAARELQKDADQLYGMNRGEEQAYDSLWAPGLGVLFVFGFFSNAVIAGVT